MRRTGVLAKLLHRGEWAFTNDDVISAAHAVIDGNKQAVAGGRNTPAEGSGAVAGVLALLMVLGIQVQWNDTVWGIEDTGEIDKGNLPERGKLN